MSRNNKALIQNLEKVGLHASAGIKRLGGNEDLYFDILKRFISSHSNDMSLLEASLSNQDYEAVYRLIHSLRSVTGHIAADDLSEQMRALLQNLKKNLPPQDFSLQFDRIIKGYNQLAEELKTIDYGESSLKRPDQTDSLKQEIGQEELFESLKQLLEFLEFQQPEESLVLAENLILMVHHTLLQENLRKIKEMIGEYNFADSVILVQSLIDSL